MAEDPEKKFQSIMNKLFHSPKSTLPLSSSSSIAQKIRGQKRPYSTIEPSSKGDKGEGIPNAAQAPPCRPWHRGDLMRRLATFKSMRWFAKPKIMDAVNCARRGWVNVDFDIIACEVCGARLQFSTPSTWSQQQVEKAALVFSLKLESGHKLLCPWIDNACDEKLALFPPLPAHVLVDHYKERSASLLQLSALPVISASVIESMRNPELEYFLKQSITVECGVGPNGSSWTEYLGNDVEAVSSGLYYQALRLLSLCGWEPRLLPYVVDSGDQSHQSANDKDLSYVAHAAAGETNNKLCVYVSASGGSGKENKDSAAPVAHYDPSSTALDCKLCGASIGLWAFATVSRPLEIIRVVGYTEVGRGSNHGTDISSAVSKESTPLKNTLSYSIAGGPPPTKQNFRATISLPVVGRNVRARFSCGSSEVRNTNEESHRSSDAIVEGSVETMQSLETICTGSNNLPAIGDVGKSNQGADYTDSPAVGMLDAASQACVEILNENGIQRDLSPRDEEPNLEERPLNEPTLRKDTSRISRAGQQDNGVGDTANTALQKDDNPTSIEADLRTQSSDNKMEFHPIRQHRYFCPWVASTGTTTPGWKQTLSALQKEKVFVIPDINDSPSPSVIKVDDPITSIRKLFESPPTKRVKPT